MTIEADELQAYTNRVENDIRVEMLRELMAALGHDPAVARPQSPAALWAERITEVSRLKAAVLAALEITDAAGDPHGGGWTEAGRRLCKRWRYDYGERP